MWEEPHAGAGAEYEASSSRGRRSSRHCSPHSPSRCREGGGGNQERLRAGDEQRSAGTFPFPSSPPRAEPVGDNSQLFPSSSPSCGATPQAPAALRAQPRRHHVRRGRGSAPGSAPDPAGAAPGLIPEGKDPGLIPPGTDPAAAPVLIPLGTGLAAAPVRASPGTAAAPPGTDPAAALVWVPPGTAPLLAPLSRPGTAPVSPPGSAPGAGAAVPAMGAAGAPPP